MVTYQSQTEEMNAETNCKNVTLVNDYNNIATTPIQRLSSSQSDPNQGKTYNPIIASEFDEYGVLNSGDEVDRDCQPVGESDNDEVEEEELQQVTQEQGLSSRDYQQANLKTKKISTTISDPICRTKTRLYCSKNSQ